MKAGRMRAAILAGPRRLEIAEVERPAPRAGEVLVRLEGCGVCGSNLVPWQGRAWFRYPFAPGEPGHEGWGRVAAVGDGVDGLAEGDRVALLSGAAFAEFDVAPAARVVRLPDAVRGPFPGEALGCGVNVWRKARIRADDAVALVGAGFLGLVVLRLAACAGAQVVAISRRETARRRALELGAAAAVPLADRAGTAEAARRAAGGRPFDVVVEAVGSQEALDLASDLPREGGRLVIAGYHQDGLRTVDLCAWNWRALELVNAHERDPRVQRQRIADAAAAVADGRLDVPALYASYPLDRIGAAFGALEERPDGFVKALVTP